MSEPATTTSMAKTCTHRRQYVSDPIAVNSCSAVAENDVAACDLKPECQVRTSFCLFDKLWINVKYLNASSSTWFSGDDDLKGHEVVNTGTEHVFPFHSANFTEFWFVRTLTTGGKKWVRALKANVVPATQSASFSASVVSTYQSSTS